MNYERGLTAASLDEHVRQCQFGIARTNIKIGDYKKGVRNSGSAFRVKRWLSPTYSQIKLAMELGDKQLLHDCAEALIGIGHATEAAHLYEMAESWDQACQLFVQLKAWQKVHSILPHVTSAKMHAVYAKACENDGKYEDAINSYRNAGDMESVIRIYLDHLSDPLSASEIVVDTKSIEGSKMLARWVAAVLTIFRKTFSNISGFCSFYQNIGDIEQALQFLIMCGCTSDAFALAQRHNKLRQYAEVLENSDYAQPSNYLDVAQHFEREKYTLLAGKYYFFAKEYSKVRPRMLRFR